MTRWCQCSLEYRSLHVVSQFLSIPAIVYSNPHFVAAQTHRSFAMVTKNGINGDQAFENTSTNVAASQMRNALNKLVDTVTDPNEKKVSVPSLGGGSND